MNKLQTAQVNAFKQQILNDDKVVEQVLLVVAGKQTAEERCFKTTVYDNGVGFSGADANFGMSLVEGIVRKEKQGLPEGQRLSPKQLPYARKMALKYAGQLVVKLGYFVVAQNGENA